MAMVMMPDPILFDFVKALGLPEGTTEFTLHASVDDICSVTCKYHIERKDLEAGVKSLHEMKEARFVLTTLRDNPDAYTKGKKP